MKGVYCQWTDQEKDMLKTVVEKCKIHNKKIDWEKVVEHFPNRTKCQVKAQYTNCLKPENDTYHKWTLCEKSQLYLCILMYNSDYKVIQQYFPKFTEMQLRSKGAHLEKQHQKFQIIMDLLNKDEGVKVLQFFNMDDLSQLTKKIDMMQNRISLSKGEKINKITELDECMGKIQIDPIEMKEIKIWSEKFDIDTCKKRLTDILFIKQIQ